MQVMRLPSSKGNKFCGKRRPGARDCALGSGNSIVDFLDNPISGTASIDHRFGAWNSGFQAIRWKSWQASDYHVVDRDHTDYYKCNIWISPDGKQVTIWRLLTAQVVGNQFQSLRALARHAILYLLVNFHGLKKCLRSSRVSIVGRCYLDLLLHVLVAEDLLPLVIKIYQS